MDQHWESVIGLEVHVQLKTRSKIFSGAATDFGAAPNAQACGVDIALPGVLPVLNAAVVRMAVLFGLAVQGRIARRCRFDRKNYFYPDLPKGYQISQLDEPIVSGGHLDIGTEDGARRRIDLTRAHLEEDAGKSLHEAYEGYTGIDLNRAGTPLLEIVSEPQLRTPAEAARYFRTLHALVRYLDICDGDLSQGSMRCDANVSIRRPGDELGERTEIKNLNSFRFLEKAVRFEIARQIDILEAGARVERETLLYDAERDETRPMRGKELSDDYRYFPDPDLLPVEVTEAMLEEARCAMPELSATKRRRYADELGLADYDAGWLVADPDVAAYFEGVAAASGLPKAAANWVMGEVAAAQRQDGTDAAPHSGAGSAAGSAPATHRRSNHIRQDRQDVVRVAMEGRRRRRFPHRAPRPQADERCGRTRRRRRASAGEQSCSGRPVQGRQNQGARLLRGPSDEGNARQGQPAPSEPTIARCLGVISGDRPHTWLTWLTSWQGVETGETPL